MDGYVKLRFLSDEKEQWAELLQSEYGLQQSWLVLKPMATAIGTGGAAPTGIRHQIESPKRRPKKSAQRRLPLTKNGLDS
jgi:hypothetical protein